ncbi:hypothetical protein MKW94_024644 [Papaver nudicaule]|uniref:AP2/ERF domain-containing protein n=1 Tax=Papaver nudicaule TaxID=74823 RepID=A0AA41UXB5_PAPNU|nr:hypothetical protein [Papaver nudicaule]
MAYDEAARSLRGPKAKTNFGDGLNTNISLSIRSSLMMHHQNHQLHQQQWSNNNNSNNHFVSTGDFHRNLFPSPGAPVMGSNNYPPVFNTSSASSGKDFTGYRFDAVEVVVRNEQEKNKMRKEEEEIQKKKMKKTPLSFDLNLPPPIF